MHNQNDNPKVRTSVNPAIDAMLEDQAQWIRGANDMSIFRYDGRRPDGGAAEFYHSRQSCRRRGGVPAGDVLVSPLEADDTDTGFECETQIIVHASSGPPRDRHKMR